MHGRQAYRQAGTQTGRQEHTQLGKWRKHALAQPSMELGATVPLPVCGIDLHTTLVSWRRRSYHIIPAHPVAKDVKSATCAHESGPFVVLGASVAVKIVAPAGDVAKYAASCLDTGLSTQLCVAIRVVASLHVLAPKLVEDRPLPGAGFMEVLQWFMSHVRCDSIGLEVHADPVWFSTPHYRETEWAYGGANIHAWRGPDHIHYTVDMVLPPLQRSVTGTPATRAASTAACGDTTARASSTACIRSGGGVVGCACLRFLGRTGGEEIRKY